MNRSLFRGATPWPKIIAALVGGVGLSGLFSAWFPVFEPVLFFSVECDWRVLLGSAVLLAISYPLATGREWARRVLLWAVSLIGMIIVLWRGVLLLFPMSYTDISPEQVKVAQLAAFLSDFSWFILIITLLSFFVLLLSHPDVVASFGTSKKSNKATDGTGPRPDA
jgi:hypothetical protein